MQQEEASSQRMSRTGAKIKCSHCRKEGHDKKGCQLKKQYQQQVDLVPGTEPTEELLFRPIEGGT